MARVEAIGSSPVVVIVGPADDVNPYGGTYRKWLLRSFVNKRTRTVTTQLYVEIGYVGGWRRYTIASDTATHLAVARIGSRVDTCFGKGVCSLDETVGIQLDDAQLRSHAQLGYTVRISAKSGESVSITVEPEQIQAQLSALAKFGRLSPATSPSKPMGRKATAQLLSTTTSLICITGDRSVYLGMSPRISPACGPKPA
jgi:hypothetical protein